MPSLQDICASCGRTNGVHRAIGDSCPIIDPQTGLLTWHPTQTFTATQTTPVPVIVKPSLSDICATCGSTYGAHCGFRCPNPGGATTGYHPTNTFTATTSAPVGNGAPVSRSTTLDQCPIGSKILITRDGKNYTATVLKHGNPTFTDNSSLIGWPPGTPDSDHFGWEKSTRHHYIPLMGTCQYGYWARSDYTVKLLSSGLVASAPTAVKPSGMACKSCGTFNSYAEPNRPNGDHICYSCKSSGY